MATNIDVPSLGESITEAVLLRWLRNDGDQVAADEPVAELETDKANVDLPAAAAGVLRIVKKVGDTVRVGETIARTEAVSSAKSAAPPAQASGKPAQPPEKPSSRSTAPATSVAGKSEQNQSASVNSDDLRPSVRRMIQENNLNPSAVVASGPGGRIIKEDVARHMEERDVASGNGESAIGAPASATLRAALPARPPARAATGTSSAPVAAPPGSPGGPAAIGEFDANGVKRVAMSKIRKRIAERLVHAQQTAAILTTFNEVDLSAVMALRTKYKDRFNETHGVSLGFMSFFARAVVMALHEFPRVNAFLEGDDVVYHNYVNLGIAVSTDRGLTVPVLKNAQAMSFAKIELEIKRLAAAARDGKLGLAELSGATFTITNGGVFGSLLSTPILSPPESGILGMHAIKERPIAVAGKVEIRPMMFVALSYDHRVVDGRESVSFLVRLKDLIEDPARLILEI
jgi:2-oxoglutarate dehydrogenase E2 component (dihydrolipoamide succinyltransferase)